MKFDIGVFLIFSLAILEVELSSVGNSKGNRDQIELTVKQAENLRKQITCKSRVHLKMCTFYQISGGWIAG